jgi:hypothetical protein
MTWEKDRRRGTADQSPEQSGPLARLLLRFRFTLICAASRTDT